MPFPNATLWLIMYIPYNNNANICIFTGGFPQQGFELQEPKEKDNNN